MKIIGNRQYPDDFDGVMRKSKLEDLLREQLKKELDYHLMEFLEEKFDPELLYNTYLQNDLAKGVNIPGKMFAEAKTMSGDWDNKGWVKLIANARSHVKGMIKNNAIDRMYETEEFLAYHKAQGGTLERAENAPEEQPSPKATAVVQAAKRLGIDNPDALRAYIAALEKHGALKLRPVARKFLRERGVKLKVDNFNEFLFRGGFAKRPEGVQPELLGQDTPEIKLNKKALTICGFENIRGDKALARIRTFILAMQRKDKKGAEVVFAKILKEEPLQSLLNGDKVIDVFKRMQKRKAFEIL